VELHHDHRVDHHHRTDHDDRADDHDDRAAGEGPTADDRDDGRTDHDRDDASGALLELPPGVARRRGPDAPRRTRLPPLARRRQGRDRLRDAARGTARAAPLTRASHGPAPGSGSGRARRPTGQPDGDPATSPTRRVRPASTCSRVGTRRTMYHVPTPPRPSTTAARTGWPSTTELTAQAVSIMPIATTLMRRGIPRPSRWSRTIGPILGRPSTHRSNRGLDRAKHHAANTKNPVVGRPGTTMPRPPRPTAAQPRASSATRRATIPTPAGPSRRRSGARRAER